jgi:hypothetical protein
VVHVVDRTAAVLLPIKGIQDGGEGERHAGPWLILRCAGAARLDIVGNEGISMEATEAISLGLDARPFGDAGTAADGATWRAREGSLVRRLGLDVRFDRRHVEAARPTRLARLTQRRRTTRAAAV